MMSDRQNALKQGFGIASAIWKHPANQGREVQAVLQFLGWQISKRTTGHGRVIDFHGKKLMCYPDSPSTGAALYFNGLADFWEMKFLLAYLRPGDSFLDIGANAGVYSILAAACVGNDGSIDSFEPMEDMAGRIEDQAKLNGLSNLHVHRLVVGEHNGPVEFGFSTNNAERHIRRAVESIGCGIRLQSVRLDDFQPEKRYAMGKMDIEGAEPMALRGCAERLRQSSPPVWLLEIAGYSTCYGIATEEVISFLSEAGYRCAIYEPTLRRITYTDSPWECGVTNVLAISASHESFVEERIVATSGI